MKTNGITSLQLERRRLYFAVLGFVAALILFAWLARAPLRAGAASEGYQYHDLPVPAVKDSGPILIYGMRDHPGFTVAKIQKETVNGKPQWKLSDRNEILPFGDSRLQISRMVASPDGKRIAVEVYNDTNPSTWILDVNNGRMSPAIRVGYSQLLSWHPDSQHLILKVLDVFVEDPGLWLVDVNSGEHVRIDVPDLPAEGLLGAAVSPDGKSLAYAFSKGMGFGSELWIMDLTNNTTRQIGNEEYGIVGYILWSQDGRQVVFTAMADSPVPFDEAGLFIVNADGSDRRVLSSMDGGHGQAPVFSRDGRMLFFVERVNRQDKNANYDPAALVSSIRSVDLTTRQVTELVSAEGADQLDISLSTEGDIFFVSNRGGSHSEIWVLDSGGNLQQITTDGNNKRFPLSVASH